jgi:hypothetical protein
MGAKSTGRPPAGANARLGLLRCREEEEDRGKQKVSVRFYSLADTST